MYVLVPSAVKKRGWGCNEWPREHAQPVVVGGGPPGQMGPAGVRGAEPNMELVLSRRSPCLHALPPSPPRPEGYWAGAGLVGSTVPSRGLCRARSRV